MPIYTGGYGSASRRYVRGSVRQAHSIASQQSSVLPLPSLTQKIWYHQKYLFLHISIIPDLLTVLLLCPAIFNHTWIISSNPSQTQGIFFKIDNLPGFITYKFCTGIEYNDIRKLY